MAAAAPPGGAPAATAAPAGGTAAAPAGGAPPPAAGGGPLAAGQPPPIPPNKPGEPAFQLKLEPDTRLEFKSDKLTEEPCQIEVKLMNPTKDRQTYKVKCTSNDIFRVRPPLGFCDAEGTTPIKITFSSKTVPDSGRHYFAFYHMKSDEKEKPARQVWTAESKPEGVRRIVVYFLKADGTPAAATAPAAGGTTPAVVAGGTTPAAAAGGTTPAAAAGGTAPAAAAGGTAPTAAGGAAGGAAPAPAEGAAPPAAGGTAPAK